MSKHFKLTEQQKELIYALYDKNVKTKGKPDYEGIKVELMKLSPPLILSKQVLSYHISQRKDKAKTAVRKAEQNLKEAQQEHFEVTGEQVQELNFNENFKEITPENAPVMLKFFEAQLTQFKLELERGRYIHIDEVTEEIQKIYDTLDRALNTLKIRLIPEISPLILSGNNTAATTALESECKNILNEIEEVIYSE